MAITVSTYAGRGGKTSAPTFVSEINVLCDDSYPAGGWELSLAEYLPSGAAIIGAFVDDHVELTGYQFVYDRASDKLKVFECAASGNPMGELATAAALDGKNIRLVVLSY